MAASDPQIPWLTKGGQCCPKDQDYLDPYVWYDFFDSAHSAKTSGKHHTRAKSAAPRISRSAHTKRRTDGMLSSASSVSLKNPSPTPATSPPASLKSWRYSPRHKHKPAVLTSPTALYLGSQRQRCKSAPPGRPFGVRPPQRPKTARSGRGPVVPSAPKRAWQLRTSSAKTHHAVLSPEEVQARHKVRCKSAPLPYDFSSIEVVAEVPQQASETFRLQAMTRPLACMPDIVQNVLTHNGLRHCCSAYAARPKTSPDTRQQFWPVSRPTTFHRGSVPKYLHFVQPIRPGSRTPTAQSTTHQSLPSPEEEAAYDVDRTDLSLCASDAGDLDDAVLYEEQFLIPATPSEPGSISEHWQSDEEEDINRQGHDARGTLSQDLMARYLEDLSNQEAEVPGINLPEDPEPLEPLKEDEEEQLQPDLMVEVVVSGRPSSENEHPAESEHEDVGDVPGDDADLRGAAGEDRGVEESQEGTHEEAEELGKEMSEVQAGVDNLKDGNVTSGDDGGVTPPAETDHTGGGRLDPEQLSVSGMTMMPKESVIDLAESQKELPSQEGNLLKDSPPVRSVSTELSSFKPSNQVKFADSIVLTSYKSPAPKPEATEAVSKSILKPATGTQGPVRPAEPAKAELPTKRVKPGLDRRGADLRPQTKENQPWAMKVKDGDEEEEVVRAVKPDEEKKGVEQKEEKKALPGEMPKVGAEKPRYVTARGAYKMYQAQDLLHYHQEQNRERRQAPRKSIPSVMPYSTWSAESAAVVTSVMEEEKRKKEGLKPWLQGRLALSKQTSRFELPMDIRVLEAMTPLDYLMKYCIISTRRKALYKNVFQRVDRDRDSKITFKEFDKALKEIHAAAISSQQILKIAELVEVDDKSIFSPDQFAAIAAFSERLLFSDFATPETSSKTHDSKEIIEEADFCGLKYKLNGLKINPPVRKILEIL